MRFKTTQLECEATIARGLPVIVRATLNPAEPDVGIMTPYLDDFEYLWCGSRGALPDQLVQEITPCEQDKIEEALRATVGEGE